MSTGQSAVMHCGGSKGRIAHSVTDKRVGGTAGKTIYDSFNTRHSERFRDTYAHENALYKCPVLIFC